MEANEVKKELYKSKANAKLECVIAGTMYYSVPLADGVFQFPIHTMDPVVTALFKLGFDDPRDKVMHYVQDNGQYYVPSADLGTTSFSSEMKASELNRWITKAIEKDEFVRIR